MAAVSAQEPLDKLQVELNSVLFQVGKIFRAAHQGDSKTLHQAKTRAKDGVPQAQESFANSLDQLEMDLTAARSVLNRDLANLRNKRAERERTAGAARLQNGQSKPDTRTPKPDKKEPKANGKAAEQASQAGSNVKSEPRELKAEPDEGPSKSDADTSLLNTDTAGLEALDSMFAADLGGSTGLGFNSSGQSQIQGFENGAGMGADGLLSDVAMIDGADFSLLGTNEDSSDISSLLPGLEKYVNQNQENSAGSNGQAAATAVDDFDLDVLLNEMTGGGETSQGQGSNNTTDGTTSDAKAIKGEALNVGTNTSAANAAGQALTSSDNAPTEDAGLMDFSNESAFDIDYDGLTAGGPDGSTLVGGDANLDDWFNFD